MSESIEAINGSQKAGRSSSMSYLYTNQNQDFKALLTDQIQKILTGKGKKGEQLGNTTFSG